MNVIIACVHLINMVSKKFISLKSTLKAIQCEKSTIYGLWEKQEYLILVLKMLIFSKYILYEVRE